MSTERERLKMLDVADALIMGLIPSHYHVDRWDGDRTFIVHDPEHNDELFLVQVSILERGLLGVGSNMDCAGGDAGDFIAAAAFGSSATADDSVDGKADRFVIGPFGSDIGVGDAKGAIQT